MIHSFFVPNFSEKIDAVPGIATTLRVTPTRTGHLPGRVHRAVRGGPLADALRGARGDAGGVPGLAALTEAERAAADRRAASAGGAAGHPGRRLGRPAQPERPTSPGAPAAGGPTSPAAGKAVFLGSAGCGSCHTLAAAGTTGTVGPNLGTDVVSNAKKAHEPLKQYIQQSITSPNAYITPGFQPNIMPQTFSKTLTSTQIQALVNFIASVTK